MELGIANRTTNNLTHEIEWAARHGFAYVDIRVEAPGAALGSTDWESIRKQLEDNNLEAVCRVAGYLPLNNPSPAVRTAAVNEARRSIDAAQISGASVVTVPFVGWPPYLSDQEGYRYWQQMLDILIRHAADQSIDIALENSHHNQHQLKFFREIFHRVPKLRLTYDIGNANVKTTAMNPSRDYLFALADRLIHVQLSDNDGQTPLHLLPGSPSHGGINLKRELSTLHSFGYDGRITLTFGGDRRWLTEFALQFPAMWNATT